MTENAALEETIRKAVTATLKSLTPEQLRELTMEPYESGPEEDINTESEEVHDISSLPPAEVYPRDYIQSVLLTSEAPTQTQRAAIVQYLMNEGIETTMFTTAEPVTFDSPPTVEGITAEYGELLTPEAGEETTDE